jgi:hypothetical protein
MVISLAVFRTGRGTADRRDSPLARGRVRGPRKLKTPKSLADPVSDMRHCVLVRRPAADDGERAVPTAFSKAKRP